MPLYPYAVYCNTVYRRDGLATAYKHSENICFKAQPLRGKFKAMCRRQALP